MNDDGEQSRDERFMRLALRLAERALVVGELPIGAIIVVKDQVIAEAYCSDKQRGMLAHPELLSLIAADKRHPPIQQRHIMTLYSNLEPCLMCLGAAMSSCIGKIVFGAYAPADGAVARLSGMSFGSASYPEYKMPGIVGGILKDESRSLFQAFIEKSSDDALINFARGIVQSDS